MKAGFEHPSCPLKPIPVASQCDRTWCIIRTHRTDRRAWSHGLWGDCIKLFGWMRRRRRLRTLHEVMLEEIHSETVSDKMYQHRYNKDIRNLAAAEDLVRPTPDSSRSYNSQQRLLASPSPAQRLSQRLHNATRVVHSIIERAIEGLVWGDGRAWRRLRVLGPGAPLGVRRRRVASPGEKCGDLCGSGKWKMQPK